MFYLEDRQRYILIISSKISVKNDGRNCFDFSVLFPEKEIGIRQAKQR